MQCWYYFFFFSGAVYSLCCTHHAPSISFFFYYYSDLMMMGCNLLGYCLCLLFIHTQVHACLVDSFSLHISNCNCHNNLLTSFTNPASTAHSGGGRYTIVKIINKIPGYHCCIITITNNHNHKKTQFPIIHVQGCHKIYSLHNNIIITVP